MNILQNQSTSVSPQVESRDSGWEISGSYASHSPCNPGILQAIDTNDLVVGNSYVLIYTVDSYISGGVKVILGTTEGINRTSAGTYTQTIVCSDTANISFYSDGQLRISNLQYFDADEPSGTNVTLAFFDGEGNDKKWVTHYSYEPEIMIKFINKFFSVKGGALWLHNVNETRNNFYGQQYNSQLQFYINLNPTAVKNYYSMRVQSTLPWGAKETGDIFTFPRVGKPNGQSSRLRVGNFKNYQGNFFADFLRDATDPRFNTELNSLMKGALLQGQIMQITLTNEDTVEVRLLDLDVSVSLQNYTY